MALVSEIKPMRNERQSVHRATRCEVSHFTGPQGTSYLQLDTFGTSDRDFPDKVSQSIQFDENSARQLMEFISETFPNLRSG